MYLIMAHNNPPALLNFIVLNESNYVSKIIYNNNILTFRTCYPKNIL